MASVHGTRWRAQQGELAFSLLLQLRKQFLILRFCLLPSTISSPPLEDTVLDRQKRPFPYEGPC